MSDKFTLTVNGNAVEIKSKETQNVLRNVMHVETPLSESLRDSLLATDNKGRAYKDFYPQGLLEHGDPTDEFVLTIVSTKGTAVATATRQAIYNRMMINNERDSYSVSIVRTAAEGTDKPAAGSNKGEADFA